MDDKRIFDFTVIYNRHKKQLFLYVLKITKSQMIAEDIVHNVFVKFYDNMQNIAEQDKIEHWLFSVARNESMGHFRTAKIRGEEDIEQNHHLQESATPDAEFEQKEIRGLMETELCLMPVEQSEVYRLKELSGMSYREVASVLHITEDLVRSRLFKARQKLKEAIANLMN